VSPSTSYCSLVIHARITNPVSHLGTRAQRDSDSQNGLQYWPLVAGMMESGKK